MQSTLQNVKPALQIVFMIFPPDFVKIIIYWTKNIDLSTVLKKPKITAATTCD